MAQKSDEVRGIAFSAIGIALRAAALALAVALTLGADIITQHGAEHEVLFGGEQIERARHHHAYGIETLLAPEVKIEAVVAHGLDDVVDVLALQTAPGKFLILLVEREEHHTAHSLLVFVDMVHQYLHIYG